MNKEPKTTWRELLIEALEENNETWEDIEAITLTGEQLDVEFEADAYEIQGKPFTAWTKNYVYFPGCYDGCEWIDYVSRHPDGKPTGHVGGGP